MQKTSSTFWISQSCGQLSSAQFLLLFCIFTACKGLEGTTICATRLHTAILALGEC